MSTFDGIPIVNPDDIHFGSLFIMWAGACGPVRGFVWADCAEDAFETWVEYLDDHAPGCLCELDYQAAAAELGVPWPAGATPEQEEAVWARAEADLTIVGHTTLKHGSAVPSWEWGLDEASEAQRRGVAEACERYRAETIDPD